MKQRGRKISWTIGATTLCLALTIASNANAQSENANCRAEIATFCAHVAPGEGRVAQCLKQSFWQLSPGCQDHARVVATSLKETLQPCHDDMLLHCTRADVAGGHGLQCLRKKGGLAPACSALAKLL